VAGELVGAVSGLGYDEFVVRRIFRPLGMGASLTNTATLARRRNVAEPHAVVRGRAIRIPRWEDPVGSGDGSILSSARDLVPWLRFQLGEGSIGSRRLVGRATFREMHEPQIPIRAGRWELGLLRALGSRPVLAYGLGWFLMDYRGRRISRHTGGIDGMSCVVTLVPDKGLGVAVLTNAEDPILPDALAFWTIDRCLGLPDRDWCAILGALARRDRARADARRRRLASTWLRRARPSVPLREYAGRYADDYYGVVTVRRRGRGLVLRFGTTFNGPLIHRHHDTFEFRPTRHPGMPFVPVSFGVGSRGLVDSLRLEVGPRETPRFRRVP
jgi:CubicO group peptidase (beta-lactamase class C family)